MQTKEVQGKLWSSAPADWVNYLEPTFIPMYEAVLEKARSLMKKRCYWMQVVDLACF
jgi:hypothetical protein